MSYRVGPHFDSKWIRRSREGDATALQNAASIAGLMLTTEAMISEIPEKKEAAGHSHGGPGGGMDGMY